MRIAAVGRGLPESCYTQERLLAYLLDEWGDDAAVRAQLERFHREVAVAQRHLALPLERYDRLRRFGQTNEAWIEAAVELGERALRDALQRAGLLVSDVDALYFASVTGIASPSIDARLVNRLQLRPDLKRMPMFGLGCVAGAAAVARAADYVKAFPDQVAAVLTVELCSLTLQRRDRSVANLISAALFGDGASAALVVGSERPSQGPQIVATESVFYPETEDVMGWKIDESGFTIRLSPAVPGFAREQLPADLARFLAAHGVERSQVRSWVCHPGGPKVLRALADGLAISRQDLALSWEHLRTCGNLSSASVLCVLGDTMEQRRPAPGELGVMLAMGPGFCSELVLLRW